MCIICYKPKGLYLPKAKIIRNCFDNNKDGGGFMYNTGWSVYIEKGFTKHYELLNRLKESLKENKLNEKDVAIAIHCRIATAGLVKAENCHPFPITDNIGELQNLKIHTDLGMCHNGIISISDAETPKLSDTQIYTRKVLSKVNFKDPAVNKLIGMSIGSSRMIIFDKDGLCESFGAFEEEKGIYYSNRTFEAYKYYTQKSGGHWDTAKGKWVDAKEELDMWDRYENTYQSYMATRDKELADREKTDEVLFSVCYECGVELNTREERVLGMCDVCERIYLDDCKRKTVSVEDRLDWYK